MSIMLPGSEGPLRERVFSLVDGTGRKGLELQEIAEQMDGAPSSEVEAALRGLEARGRAVEVEGVWYAAENTPWAVGVVEVLETGDALLRPGYREEADHFIRDRGLKGAMSGDLVLVKSLGRRAKPGDWKLPEAHVLKILSSRSDTLVGSLEIDEEGRRWLVPYDPKMSLELQVVGAEDVPEDHYVVVRVERGKKPKGNVIEVLGHPDTPGVDVRVILRHYEIPDEFPPAVLQAAAAFPADPGPADWEGREDLRGRVVITIDGASARDFDDAVSIERLPDGSFRLGVHIADVAHYVKEGGDLDMEAYRRGTSVYYPDRAIPMLPEALSNGLCSLRPGVPRLTMSAFLDIDRAGKIQSRRFAETVIQSTRRMTYDEVRRILEEPQPASDPAEYGEVLAVLREMHVLMSILHHARVKRGSIDFDLPEGNVELGTDGTVVGVTAGQRHVAHRIIEEFMLAANESVAQELETTQIPALYRVHDAPSPDRLAELREVLRPLGIEVKGNLDVVHPTVLQAVVAQAQGSPAEAFISSVVLRTMQRALYSPECRGHYALASRWYAHFTSPIRRYPDLVVHRALKALLTGQGLEKWMQIADRLPEMGEHTSTTERRAEQSERDLLQWKKVRFLADRVGDRFTGRITGVQPFGMFVQLDDYFVDGLVPVRTMADDYYVYEADSHRLVGQNSERTFQLADAVEVELTGVSLRHRGLDLRIAGMPEPGERGEWPRARDTRTDRTDRRERRGDREGGRERKRRR
jgi:ribonuclease R